MLTSLADGADLLVTGVSYEELASDVAEYRGVPLATVLWFPMRVNGHAHPDAAGADAPLGDERCTSGWSGAA